MTKLPRDAVGFVVLAALVAGASALVAGCGSSSGDGAAGHGSSGATSGAGTSAFGGAPNGTTTNGGAPATGGTTSASGGANGASATSAGGNAGASNTARGGAPADGSANGGTSGNGGASASLGGRTARGGQSGVNAGMSGAGGANGGAGTSGATSTGGGAGTDDITVPAGYTLVWHDEFDVDGAPDPKNWQFESGFVRNEEDQWYQTANASVSNGELVIEARQEQVANPNYQAGSSDWKTNRQYAQYTSSSINTSGLQSFQYGRFELRARIPTASGMWPAWWTLGVKGEWPSNGEIDIMEYYQNKVLANVACGTSTEWQAKWDSASKSLSSLGAGWSDDFHVWRMDWDDQNITLYLDDQTMNTSALADMLNADGTSPFKQKAYMLINLALGGQNGGSLDGTSFPQRYEVDYVRVFQKN